jgi:hypothetical protein
LWEIKISNILEWATRAYICAPMEDIMSFISRFPLAVGLLAAALLSAVSFVIVPCLPNTPDNVAYISMASGDYNSTPAPYRFRLLAPTLAGRLPMLPANALRAVTVASLFIVYLLALKLCASLGMDLRSSLLALALFFSSRTNLFTYYNPFLTDALGLVILFALTIAFLSNKALPFTVIACLGVWNRETALFIAPAWLLTRRWKQGIGITAIVIVAFLLPRMFGPPTSSYALYIHNGVSQSTHSFSLSGLITAVIQSWQGMWLLAIGAFAAIPRRLKIVALALTTGALASSCLVTDHERMFSILAPIMVPCAAFMIERALHHSSRLIIFLIVSLSIITFLFGLGTSYVYQSVSDPVRHKLIAFIALLSFAICGYITFASSKDADIPSRLDIPPAELSAQ